jgi:hypothetical protein
VYFIKQCALALGLLSNGGSNDISHSDQVLLPVRREGPFVWQEEKHNVSFSNIHMNVKGTHMIEENGDYWNCYKIPQYRQKKKLQCYRHIHTRSSNLYASPSFMTENQIAFWEVGNNKSYYCTFNLETGSKEYVCSTSSPPSSPQDFWSTFTNYHPSGLQALGSVEGCIKVLNTVNNQEIMLQHLKSMITGLWMYPNQTEFSYMISQDALREGFRIWDIYRGALKDYFEHPHAEVIRVVENNSHIFSMCEERIKLWDVRHSSKPLKHIIETGKNKSLLPLWDYDFVLGSIKKGNKATFSLCDLRKEGCIEHNLVNVEMGACDCIKHMSAHYIPQKHCLLTAVSYGAHEAGEGLSVVKGLLPIKSL